MLSAKIDAIEKKYQDKFYNKVHKNTYMIENN